MVVLTTAVFAVIISAPAGAILVNSLGTKLLTYDGIHDDGNTEGEVDPNKGDDSKPDIAPSFKKEEESIEV